MSSENRKQRQKQLKKEKKQLGNNLPKSNKPKKPDKITVENIPYLGDLEIKNNPVNRVIQKLFEQANKGLDSYSDYFYSRDIDSLKNKGKGLKATPSYKGNFSGKVYYEILWKDAFTSIGAIDFSCIDKNDKEGVLKQLLAQLLNLATQRAIKNAKKDLSTNDSGECK